MNGVHRQAGFDGFNVNNSAAPASSTFSQPPAMQPMTQPSTSAHAAPQNAGTHIDADFIETVITNSKTRLQILLGDCDPALLPLSRKVLKQAVACGLQTVIRNAAGEPVKVVHPNLYKEVLPRPLEPAELEFDEDDDDEDGEEIIGSYPTDFDGNVDDDSGVNWTDILRRQYGLAERGEAVVVKSDTVSGPRAAQVDVGPCTIVHAQPLW